MSGCDDSDSESVDGNRPAKRCLIWLYSGKDAAAFIQHTAVGFTIYRIFHRNANVAELADAQDCQRNIGLAIAIILLKLDAHVPRDPFPTSPSGELEELFVAFADEAFKVLMANPRAHSIPVYYQQRVSFVNPPGLTAQWVPMLLPEHTIYELREVWGQLPSSVRLVEALRERNLFTPIMSDNAGRPVTPNAEQLRAAVLEKLGLFLSSCVKRYQSLDPGENSVREHFVRFQDTWLRSPVRRIVIVPLWGFSSQVDEIVIDENHAIGPLTSDLKGQLCTTDPFGGAVITAQELAECSHAVLGSYDAEGATFTNSSAMYRAAVIAVRCLRLLKSGSVAPTVVFDRTEHGDLGAPASTSYQGDWRPLMRIASRYQFQESDLAPFNSLLTLLKDLELRRAAGDLHVCLRRFEMTYTRESPEDKVIDLTIALESTILFGENQELTFKLAMRGAQLLRDHFTPSYSFDLLRALYKMRSKIVHNGMTLESEAPDRRLGPVARGQFLNAAEDWVRKAIIVYAKRICAGETVKTIAKALDKALLKVDQSAPTGGQSE